MPLILPKEAEAAWLDSKQTDAQAALDRAQAAAVTAVVHHPVSSRVNNSRSTGANLIEPFLNPAAAIITGYGLLAVLGGGLGLLSIFFSLVAFVAPMALHLF